MKADYPYLSIQYNRPIKKYSEHRKGGMPKPNELRLNDDLHFLLEKNTRGGIAIVKVAVDPFITIEARSVCSYTNCFSRQVGRSIAIGRLLAYYPKYRREIVTALSESGVKPDDKLVQRAYLCAMQDKPFIFPPEYVCESGSVRIQKEKTHLPMGVNILVIAQHDETQQA